MKKNKLKKYIEILKENNLLLEENISEELKEKEINIVTYDSREVKENTLFICKGSKFKIEYLTALLVGKRKIGKKKLIKYMLQLNNDNPTETYKNFRKYRSIIFEFSFCILSSESV